MNRDFTAYRWKKPFSDQWQPPARWKAALIYFLFLISPSSDAEKIRRGGCLNLQMVFLTRHRPSVVKYPYSCRVPVSFVLFCSCGCVPPESGCKTTINPQKGKWEAPNAKGEDVESVPTRCARAKCMSLFSKCGTCTEMDAHSAILTI